MSAPQQPNAADAALLAGRRRGMVDEQLLSVLREQPLLIAVQMVEGQPRYAVHQIAGKASVPVWTTPSYARTAGWVGDLAEQSGAALAAALHGSDLFVAVNVGQEAGVHLTPPDVAQLAGSSIAAGSTVYLGEPATTPPGLTDAVTPALLPLPVSEARLAAVAVGSAPPHLMVILTPSRQLLPAERSSTAEAVRAALDQAAIRTVVDVAFLDQLGALSEPAQALPTFHRT
ncbi:type III secretion system (T3SS) SseB-like protein [Kineococcus xinjiangensis]|uniref:Type III secretion system (T3SS) SseB-like protein n=1 Tax=Kineococcus xinjiangensis TaxID=512762 RepID=A0A2S6IC01_9ACTN|nr:enhanced serine sensitivity protein SseB C-terminal domain-containing protein [Kineococcus xinjiangensis]PPK90201.1 type III secretion system (T3SS) SseB-like protein [Kineococcus xinjiangensis]